MSQQLDEIEIRNVGFNTFDGYGKFNGAQMFKKRFTL